MPNGSEPAPPAPPGLSTNPLVAPTCGWNGGLPPSSSESFSVTRLWNTPELTLTIVLSFSPYDRPTRGSNTL